jgi:F-type H+-transporting ATPase subunit a
MHQLLITEWLNRVFAGPVDGVLGMLRIHPVHPEAPIPDHVAMQFVVVLILTAFFVIVRLGLSVESPSGPQHVIEGIQDFTANLGRDLIGHHYHGYLPYLMVLGMFILTSNLLGLIPGL